MKNLTKLKEDKDFQDKLKNFTKKYFFKKTKELVKKYHQAKTNNTKFPDGEKDFENKWTELKDVYFEKQGERCCICEKEMNDIYSKDIEHYRPKSVYWWLAYNPENYYLCCAECNRSYKKDNFPLQNGQNHTLYENRKNINTENPLLLNPMNDNPEDFFQLCFIIHSETNTGVAILQPKNNIDTFSEQRAKETIRIYNLDLHKFKSDTDESRLDLLNNHYQDLFEIAKARIKKNTQKEFKDFLLTKIQDKPALKTLDLLQLVLRAQITIHTL